MVQRGLLQAEHVDHGPVQDVVGLGEELVEAPTLLLIGLQDVGEHRSQEALKAPETPEHTRCSEPHQLRESVSGYFCLDQTEHPNNRQQM